VNQIFKCKDCNDKCAQRKHGQICSLESGKPFWLNCEEAQKSKLKKVLLGRNHYKQVKRQRGKYLTQSKC